MKKKIPNMKFRVGSEQESVIIQKLLFMIECKWWSFGKNIQETNHPYLYAYYNTITFGVEGDLYENHPNKETTLEELKSIVGEYLYGDILGCQVSIPSGTAFVTRVKLNKFGVVFIHAVCGKRKLKTMIYDHVRFYINDYNDDTLLFEDFLKFIRSEEEEEENTND